MKKTNERKCYLLLNQKLFKIFTVALFVMALGMNNVEASVDVKDGKITIKRTNTSISDVIKEIERETDYTFFINDNQIDVEKKVSVDVLNVTIEQIMNTLLKGTNYTFQIFNHQVIIKSKKSHSEKENRKITGKVEDENGEALIGASVVIKGTTIGTITDVDGNFSLSGEMSDQTALVYSYLGMKSLETIVGNKKDFDVKLHSDTKLIDEVVVTAMGIQRQSKTLSYTAQSVSGNELTRVKDANLINSLQGKSAGLVITPNANGAGGSSKILLRGNKSIQGNNTPLIVIDGVPMANNKNDSESVVYGGGGDNGDALSTLNPDDIAGISVLKGASAAALYGSVAANGVIMITTKKGSEGKIRVDVSSNMTIETAYNLPKLQYNYGVSVNPTTNIPNEFYSWETKRMNKPGFNQIKDFFQTGYNLNNSISLSGGSQNSQTYFSYGNTTSKGIVPTNKFERHNLSYRQNFDMFDKRLSFDVTANYTYSKTKNKTGGGMLENPLVGLYLLPRNVDYKEYRDNYETINPERPTVPIQNWIVSDYKFLEEHNQNPFWMLNRIPANTKRHRFSTSGSVKYRITDYLNIQGRLSYERDNLISRKEKYATTYRTSMGAYNQTTSFYEHLYGDALLNFNKVVSDFSITATAGAGFTKEQSTGTYHNAEGDQFYWIDTTDKNGNPYRVPQGNTYFMNVFHRDNYYDVYLKETFSEKRLNSVFGTFQLGYKELAYVDFTARNDWSSTLAFTKNKSMSFFYPSVGVTILLNDIFNMNKDLFNLVKVRGSYSVVGNDLPAYLSRPVPMVNGTSVTLPSLMPFTDLKSEKTYSVEAGFDLSLFESRLNIDFTFYKANTKNQYFQVDAPASSGYAKRNINAGNIQNMGVETSVNYHFSFNNEWSWTPGINFSYNDNKIVEICPGTDEYILASSDAVVMKLKKNGSYGDMYTHQLLRDEKGNILLDDNGTPMKTPDFDHYSGNFNSKIRLGWSNTINWKDLSIYALIDGKIGGKVMSMTEAIMDGYGVSENSGNARDKGGIANTDGSLIDAQKYYSTVGGRAQNASFVAEEYMYDATNFRLRELSVGYTFRNLFGIGKNLTTSIVGRNLFFFYKDSPCDPDISGSTGNGWQGIDVFSLPSTRTFGLNLKLTF